MFYAETPERCGADGFGGQNAPRVCVNIVHTSAVQAPQIATSVAPAAAVPESGFHEALATAQNAEPGREAGAATNAVPPSATNAANTKDAGTTPPGKKEKGRVAESGANDRVGVQPIVLAAALTVPAVAAAGAALPSIADPAASLQQSAGGKAGAKTVEILSQNLSATPGEGPGTVDAPGAPSGAAPDTQAASLPSLPVPLVASAGTQASSVLPADARKQHPESAVPSTSSSASAAAPHAVTERSTPATPVSASELNLGKVHAPEDLGSPAGAGALSAQVPGTHPLPSHHGDVSGKAAAPGNSVVAAKPTSGATPSSQSKTADDSGNPGGGNAGGSSSGTSDGGTATAAGKEAAVAAPLPAIAIEGPTASGNAAVLSGASLLQAGPVQNAALLAPTDAGAGRASTPLPNTPPANEATTAINTAQVLGRMNGTEMRVGMRSEEFGSISIQTSVSPGNVVAQIALDHGALGRALAVHLPAMEEKLGTALGVAARVELRDTALQSSMQGSNGGAAGNGTSANGGAGSGSHAASGGSFSRRAFDMDSGPQFAGGEVNGSPGERLSIHA